jgi:DNA-binding YbaB/EbfC family protein
MMRNMAGMMKKMQETQGRLAAMQGDLANMEFTAIVGSGAISATVTGDGKLAKLKLGPDVLDPADSEMLEDMICLATNNALQQAAEEKAKMMKEITGGLPLPPGLNLPF